MEFKEKLKKLREEKRERIKEIQLMVKEQNMIIGKIKDCLQHGPRTPVEISKETSLPSARVMYYLASLKKYGEVVEGEKQGEYFTYALKEN